MSPMLTSRAEIVKLSAAMPFPDRPMRCAVAQIRSSGRALRMSSSTHLAYSPSTGPSSSPDRCQANDPRSLVRYMRCIANHWMSTNDERERERDRDAGPQPDRAERSCLGGGVHRHQVAEEQEHEHEEHTAEPGRDLGQRLGRDPEHGPRDAADGDAGDGDGGQLPALRLVGEPLRAGERPRHEHQPASRTPAAAIPRPRRVIFAELFRNERAGEEHDDREREHHRGREPEAGRNLEDLVHWTASSFSVLKLGSTNSLARSRPTGHATAIVVAAMTTTLKSTQPSARNAARTKPPGSFCRKRWFDGRATPPLAVDVGSVPSRYRATSRAVVSPPVAGEGRVRTDHVRAARHRADEVGLGEHAALLERAEGSRGEGGGADPSTGTADTERGIGPVAGALRRERGGDDVGTRQQHRDEVGAGGDDRAAEREPLETADRRHRERPTVAAEVQAGRGPLEAEPGGDVLEHVESGREDREQQHQLAEAGARDRPARTVGTTTSTGSTRARSRRRRRTRCRARATRTPDPPRACSSRPRRGSRGSARRSPPPGSRGGTATRRRSGSPRTRTRRTPRRARAPSPRRRAVRSVAPIRAR